MINISGSNFYKKIKTVTIFSSLSIVSLQGIYKRSKTYRRGENERMEKVYCANND